MEQLPTTCQLYTSVPEAWQSMLEDCRRARKSIYLEQYIFQADEIGKQFLEVFVHQAKLGVDIRLLLDLVGSITLFFNRALRKQLAGQGVQIRWYNPIAPLFFLRIASFYFRDHRKLLIVDGEIGHTGGVGVNYHMASWRDTHGRLTGPVAKVMEASFLELWMKAKKPLPHLLSKIHLSHGNRKIGEYEFLTNSPGPRRRYIYHAMRDAIRSSQRRVWITMPYFIPDLGLFRTLRLAARRGVDVQLLLPDRSDIVALDAAMRSYYGMALKSGIKIYTYKPSVLHAKVIVCDDGWATFGSMNWDSVSFRYNLEGNIVTTNKTVIDALSKQFLLDISQSVPVDYKAWQQRSAAKRLMEILLWPIHSLL